MKITLDSTNTFKTVDKKRLRLWQGVTERGVKIEAYIDAIVVVDPVNSDLEEFTDLAPVKR